MGTNEYSVCQFFENGTQEYVRRYVAMEEAVMVFKHYVTSVGAALGTTQCVILTDGGDFTNLEWVFGEGIVYPPQLAGRV